LWQHLLWLLLRLGGWQYLQTAAIFAVHQHVIKLQIKVHEIIVIRNIGVIVNIHVEVAVIEGVCVAETGTGTSTGTATSGGLTCAHKGFAMRVMIVYDLIDCGIHTRTLNIGETTILKEGDS
jgi:hypothetical protein